MRPWRFSPRPHGLIIFHDCGRFVLQIEASQQCRRHRRGLLNLTPYRHWRWQHALHHGTAGDLDRRGSGDIWTLTVQEYLHGTRWNRFAYRLARNPLILFVVAPLYIFLVIIASRRRMPRRGNVDRCAARTGLAGDHAGDERRDRPQGAVDDSTHGVGLCGAAGLWLFYVQHQFEGAYWTRSEDWNFTDAALQGSSFYQLPRVLQWFTGNIGFHHIHHLSPRIPNYHLQRCHEADPFFRTIKPVTLFGSLKSLTFRLWDEQHKVFVGFGRLEQPSM